MPNSSDKFFRPYLDMSQPMKNLRFNGYITKDHPVIWADEPTPIPKFVTKKRKNKLLNWIYELYNTVREKICSVLRWHEQRHL